MSKFILTDVDGVLLNWGESFERWLRVKHLYYGITVPDHSLASSMNVENWLGMTYDDTRQMVRDFNNDPDWFPYLKPFEDAVKYVEWLKNDGFKFVVISACNTDPWHKTARQGNLDRFFPEAFDTINLVDIGASKVEYLSRYRQTWWIEDHPRHAEDGAELGHMSFLINRSYNSKFQNVRSKRVSGWKDIYECITNDGCTYPGWMA